MNIQFQLIIRKSAVLGAILSIIFKQYICRESSFQLLPTKCQSVNSQKTSHKFLVGILYQELLF